MCMLIGSYYPADRATAKCSGDPAQPEMSGNLGAEWVGNGTATCAETFGCVQQAVGMPSQSFDGITTCVLASNPSVSKEMSDAVRCLFLNFMTAPTACKTQFDACLAK
jgi:hypothetical protein